MIDHAESENATTNQKVIKSYYDFGKAVSECHDYYIREKKKWIPVAQCLVKEEIRKQIPMKITDDALRKRALKVYEFFTEVGVEKIKLFLP